MGCKAFTEPNLHNDDGLVLGNADQICDGSLACHRDMADADLGPYIIRIRGRHVLRQRAIPEVRYIIPACVCCKPHSLRLR
jgi:hypothetical protein